MRSFKSFINFFFWNFKSLIVGILALFLTPTILKNVGKENYGQFRLLLDLAGQFTLLDLGVFSSITTLFGQSLATKNNRLFVDVYRESIRFYNRVSLSSVFVFIIAAYFSIRIYKIPQSQIFSFSLSFFLITFSLSIWHGRIFQAFLEADQRSYISSVGYTFYTFIYSILAIFLSTKINPLIALAASTLIASLICQIIIYSNARSKIRKITSQAKQTPNENVSQSHITKTQFDFFLSNVVGRLSLYSDQLIVAYFYPIGQVTSFYFSSRILQLSLEMLQSFTGSVWASLAEIYNGGDQKEFQHKLLFTVRVLASLSAILLPSVFCLNQQIITFWLGKEYYLDDLFSFVSMINFFIQPIMSIWGWCFSFSGRIRVLRTMTIIGLIFNVLCSVILTKYYGPIGPILGTLATYLSFSFVAVNILISKHFLIPLTSSIMSWIPGFIFLTVFSIIERSLIIKIPIMWNGWYVLIAFLIIILTNFLLNYFFIMKSEDKIFFFDKVNRIKSKFSM